MKLIINYDMMDAIRNVKDPLNPFKVVRNDITSIVTVNPGVWIINLYLTNGISGYIGLCVSEIAITVAGVFLFQKKLNIDFNADKASTDLKKLSSQLKDLYISTDYDLLLDSKVYEKKHKIELNEKKIPIIAEEKYILVPTYNYHGEIKDTSILQEHIVGSKEYVLSLGSPKKETRFAYSSV